MQRYTQEQQPIIQDIVQKQRQEQEQQYSSNTAPTIIFKIHIFDLYILFILKKPRKDILIDSTFLDYIQVSGRNIEERLLNFYNQSKQNPQWLQNSLLDFIVVQKERVIKGEISASTISNYYKPLNFFVMLIIF